METGLDSRSRRSPSLRWRLLTLVSIAALLIMTLAGALSYRQAKHEIQELMDGQMSKMAALMLVQAQQGPEHLAELPANLTRLRGQNHRRNELTLEFQIGKADGGEDIMGLQPFISIVGAQLEKFRQISVPDI